MKRITYNGETLVTGSDVVDGLVHYVTHVAGMSAAVPVEIPVLESNGTVQNHTLIVSAATQLGISDIDGSSAEDEAALFPAPEFPPVGGMATPVARERLEDDAPFIDDDPVELIGGS
ncbi:hypothetical protein [Subtercola sp. YIM 133946]|uniref:hypothetical protein n=1 Tax=Subtercola sp. YIM 133946 TaxID=3118909 RepID=UPI002F938636